MTVEQALNQARKKLKHLETPSLDSEIILSYVIKKSRESILTHPEQSLDRRQTREYDDLIVRRAKHEPVAYLTQKKEFYGRNFYVDARVHIPKPATEDLIYIFKRDISENFNGTIADIGTGSGCMAITLALEFPKAKIIAIDISKDALAVAEKNAKTLGVDSRITFLNGSLGEPIKKPVDIVVANLPYGWINGWTHDKEVFYQPKISYASGTYGLDAISSLIQQLPKILSKHGHAFLEFDPRQTDKIKKLASAAGYKILITKDSAGFERIANLTI